MLGAPSALSRKQYVALVRTGKEDEQAAVRVPEASAADVGAEQTTGRIEGTPLRIDRALRLRIGRVVPRRVDVLPRPAAVLPEDPPSVGIGPDVQPAAPVGHAAARLRGGAVEAGLAVRVVGDQELSAVAGVMREKADLPVQMPPDARRRARRVVRRRRVGVVEDDSRRERLPVHQICVNEFALRAEDDVVCAGARAGCQERRQRRRQNDPTEHHGRVYARGDRAVNQNDRPPIFVDSRRESVVRLRAPWGSDASSPPC